MKHTALIVTFNRLDKLKTTIEKTLKIGFSSIVVVNNGSTDGTQGWLRTLSEPNLIVLDFPVNIGGAGGFKKGSQYICDYISTDWIFFYDDDAYPQQGILETFSLLEYGESRVFATLVKDLNGNVCSMNLPFTKIPISLSDTLKYIKKPGLYLPSIDKSSMVQTVSFVGMIIHFDVLKNNIGYIHDELFIYFDDLYFGHHLTLAGEKIRFFPELKFIHDVSIQGKKITPEWKVYYLCRNLILGRKYFNKNDGFSFGAIFLRIIKYIAIFPYQKNKIVYLQYLVRGVIHALQGVSGRNH